MQEVSAQVVAHYRRELVERLRANGGAFSYGGLTIRLAKEFGFCYGVERAIGIHVVNNLYAGVAVGYANSVLSTPTFFEANVIDGWFGVGAIVCAFAVVLAIKPRP